MKRISGIWPRPGGFLRPSLFAALLAVSLPLAGTPQATGYHFWRDIDFVWAEESWPIRFWVSNRADNLLTVEELVEEARAAMDVWTNDPRVAATSAYAGITNLRPFDFFDSTNTVGFTTDSHFAELGISRTTLAVTSWLVEEETGQIVESDILVNAAFNWSNDPGDNLWDVRSMLVHEFGHFLGLGHSGVGRQEDELLVGSAVMWPYTFGRGSTAGRTLTDDDIQGASVLYPTAEAENGGIRGVIVDGNGTRVGHAHVSAYEPTRDLLIGVWADRHGHFDLARLPSGSYIVRVNPMPDEHPALAYQFHVDDVDRDFAVTIAPRFVTIRSGVVTEINIEVTR